LRKERQIQNTSGGKERSMNKKDEKKKDRHPGVGIRAGEVEGGEETKERRREEGSKKRKGIPKFRQGEGGHAGIATRVS